MVVPHSVGPFQTQSLENGLRKRYELTTGRDPEEIGLRSLVYDIRSIYSDVTHRNRIKYKNPNNINDDNNSKYMENQEKE